MEKLHSCEFCKTTFKHRSGIKNVFNKFCSRKCSSLKAAQLFNNKDHPNWIKDQIREKICKNCNKTIQQVSRTSKKVSTDTIIYLKRSITSFKKVKFCSRLCAEQGKSYQKKQNHWNWRGGRSPLRNLLSITQKYKNWRTFIFKRDNYTCQICKKRGGNLEADHIKPFAVIVRENNIRTVEEALQCAELWNFENGRTLCQSCHRKTFVFLGNQFTVNLKKGVKRGNQELIIPYQA